MRWSLSVAVLVGSVFIGTANSEAQSLQDIAKKMRDNVPPEAQCVWNLGGRPACSYESSNGGNFTMTFVVNEGGVISGEYHAHPANSAEAQRLGNMMFSFFDQVGFSMAAIQNCVQSPNFIQNNRNEVNLGSNKGSCVRIFDPRDNRIAFYLEISPNRGF